MPQVVTFNRSGTFPLEPLPVLFLRNRTKFNLGAQHDVDSNVGVSDETSSVDLTETSSNVPRDIQPPIEYLNDVTVQDTVTQQSPGGIHLPPINDGQRLCLENHNTQKTTSSPGSDSSTRRKRTRGMGVVHKSPQRPELAVKRCVLPPLDSPPWTQMERPSPRLTSGSASASASLAALIALRRAHTLLIQQHVAPLQPDWASPGHFRKFY